MTFPVIFFLFLYRALWLGFTPWVPLWFSWRVRQGKEDPHRLPERYGHASRSRPPGTLCWIHAISLGESQSVIPLIQQLLLRHPNMSILITTGTLTSSQSLPPSLPPRAFHQMAPLDWALVMRRFLNHWQPNLAIRVESEIWPETLRALALRHIPRAMVQARISPSSLRFWQSVPGLFPSLLQGFNPVIAQSSRDLQRLRTLGVAHLQGPLNLKIDASPPSSSHLSSMDPPWGSPTNRHRPSSHDLPPQSEGSPSGEISPDKVCPHKEKWPPDMEKRPCWLASSTHAGEEEVILAVHQKIRRLFPQLLTVILPRHPHRGPQIENLAKNTGLHTRRRTQGSLVSSETEVYIVDTLGETGLFYQRIHVVFIGGSLVPKGGHNLLEPARARCAIIHGPHVFNQSDIAEMLLKEKACLQIQDTPSLERQVTQLLGNPQNSQKMGARAQKLAQSLQGVTQKVEELLQPLFDPKKNKAATYTRLST